MHRAVQSLRRIARFGSTHRVRCCSGKVDAVIAAANVPDGRIPAADALLATQRLMTAASERHAVSEHIWADQRTHGLLESLGTNCADFDSQELRTLIATFAQSQHMPSELWQDLADEVPRALEELPNLHAVHIALLMAALDLRWPDVLLQDVVEQLELRAEKFDSIGLTAALVALSQLGPWSHPPGKVLANELLSCMGDLRLNELSASALAVATLGIYELGFWQMAHGHLNSSAVNMEPRHLADCLLALATTQNRPIALLEALLQRLKCVVGEATPEEALTCAWAMTSLQLFQADLFCSLLEIVDMSDGMSMKSANQMRQIGYSLELEKSAAKTRAALPEKLLSNLQDSDAVGDHVCEHRVVIDQLYDLLVESNCKVDLASSAGDFYTIDISVDQGSRGIILDSASSVHADFPHDPWMTLKMRHLPLLGCSAIWLPTQRWLTLDDEEKKKFVSDFVGS